MKNLKIKSANIQSQKLKALDNQLDNHVICAFYDVNKEFISVGAGECVDVPVSAKYVRFNLSI